MCPGPERTRRLIASYRLVCLLAALSGGGTVLLIMLAPFGREWPALLATVLVALQVAWCVALLYASRCPVRLPDITPGQFALVFGAILALFVFGS